MSDEAERIPDYLRYSSRELNLGKEGDEEPEVVSLCADRDRLAGKVAKANEVLRNATAAMETANAEIARLRAELAAERERTNGALVARDGLSMALEEANEHIEDLRAICRDEARKRDAAETALAAEREQAQQRIEGYRLAAEAAMDAVADDDDVAEQARAQAEAKAAAMRAALEIAQKQYAEFRREINDEVYSDREMSNRIAQWFCEVYEDKVTAALATDAGRELLAAAEGLVQAMQWPTAALLTVLAGERVRMDSVAIGVATWRVWEESVAAALARWSAVRGKE